MRKYENVVCPVCGANIGEHCHALQPPFWPLEVKHAARMRLASKRRDGTANEIEHGDPST